MADKHWYLVSYDIRDPKRWRLVYRTLKGRGERVQYSLFRCWMTLTEKEALRWELEKIVDSEDDLLFIHLCPGCAARVQVRGQESDWAKPRPRFEIV